MLDPPGPGTLPLPGVESPLACAAKGPDKRGQRAEMLHSRSDAHDRTVSAGKLRTTDMSDVEAPADGLAGGPYSGVREKNLPPWARESGNCTQ